VPNFEMREERNKTSTEGAEIIGSPTLILFLLMSFPHAVCAFVESNKEDGESQLMSPLESEGSLHSIIPEDWAIELPKPHTAKSE
jgi:hypothetical protein